MEEKDINNISENQGGRGRLRFVSKTKKPFDCSDCLEEIKTGSSCFMQNDYTTNEFFPVQKRLCMKCGHEQIGNDIIVKNPELLEKFMSIKPERKTLYCCKCGNKCNNFYCKKCNVRYDKQGNIPGIINQELQCPDCKSYGNFTHCEGKFQVCECGGHVEQLGVKYGK